MAKRGKKYLEAAKLIDRTKAYDAKEAIELVKKTNIANFDATVEVAYRLGIDTRKSDQQIRGAVVLPHRLQRFCIRHGSGPNCDVESERSRSGRR